MNSRVNWSSRCFKGQQCWPIATFLALILLVGCSAGGADSYYNDTSGKPQAQPKTVLIPTDVPTLPPPPSGQVDTTPIAGSVAVLAGDDYAISAFISLGGFFLSPVAFFLFAYAIGGPIMRRYGFKRGPQHE